ncbi:hypothetical protein [Granulicella sibirica]|uniref:Uncharacterized protein n=1 Tax=Granulicella sibirica TaxID=2479048 RepID=A0A4Q0SXP5_9BACT|nr:hypothetical protein [Granulicella sibirica]RXH55637.1 hypothetical protein GRAN_2494 [Granulicella sibirica]
MGVTILLACAVLASLTAGVLVAYGICILMFKAFRIHAMQVAETRRSLATRRALES